MKILVDTNILLDIALERYPFLEKSALLLKTAHQHQITITITPATVLDIYYFIRKAKGKETAMGFIESVLQFAEVTTINKHVVIQALRSDFADFEDAIQEYAARQANIPIIVTRNTTDFHHSDREVYTPDAFLQKFPLHA